MESGWVGPSLPRNPNRPTASAMSATAATPGIQRFTPGFLGARSANGNGGAGGSVASATRRGYTVFPGVHGFEQSVQRTQQLGVALRRRGGRDRVIEERDGAVEQEPGRFATRVLPDLAPGRRRRVARGDADADGYASARLPPPGALAAPARVLWAAV